MHLRSISLRGFKSFPDRTKLEFSPGVSVIVGPNGSGKSNVTDAVLWALGEQSPLAVRGQTMQDVIWAGGPGLPSRGFAEVEVTIANEPDGGGGGDGDEDEGGAVARRGRAGAAGEVSELSILRRLDRSGEGEYRINGARCRLVDVVEALSDTGLGKEMHSVVSQGRVEAIVHSKPRDRRLLIEEAAGLGKHRKRRRRAQLKLERTERNLERALDVEREARSRLRPLKRQAEAAELHERLERQSLEARMGLVADAVRVASGELAGAEERAGEARSVRDGLDRELAALAKRREAAEEALTERARVREELVGEVFAARAAVEQLELQLEREAGPEAAEAGEPSAPAPDARAEAIAAACREAAGALAEARREAERSGADLAPLEPLLAKAEAAIGRALGELEAEAGPGAAEEAAPAPADIEAERAELAERRDELVARLEADRGTGDATVAELRACAREEAELQGRLREASEAVTAAEVAAQRARDAHGEVAAELERIAGRLELEPEPAAEPLDTERKTELELRIDRLARRRERLGPVNPLAGREYEEAVAHVDELEAGRRDLEGALAELEGVISEADRRIRESFEQTFEAAARNFEEVVQHLFPGGRGRLRLVAPQAPRPVLAGEAPVEGGEDGAPPEAGADAGEAAADAEEEEESRAQEPEEPGVEVEVTPAGKSMRRLSLLSGGEKSLVALAFMFAVFLARPCPFYILDEVEAALDDVNIDRFLELLRRFSDRAQFIVVTHQKRTMDAADTLYGVSMGGDGVSKVVSRRLPREAEPDADPVTFAAAG